MKLYSALLASACVLALAAPASAQISALLGTSYSHISADSLSINSWNINGQGAFALPDTGFNFQGQAGYSNISGEGANANDWNVGGTAFWAQDMFRLGATLNYDSISVGGVGGNAHTTSYGGFAEWFPGILTLGVKGGGVSGSLSGFGSGSGSYVGGEAIVYPLPNLAVSGDIDYAGASGANETDLTAQAEWLVSDEVPVSLYGGYTHASIALSGLPSNGGDMVFGGLRFYLNGTGSTTLMDRQRTGTANWASSFGPLATHL